MRSIQTKFVLLILAGILLAATVIGGAGVLSSNKAIDKDSAKIMNLLCGENAEELDTLLGSIKQSVETIAVYATDRLGSVDQLTEDARYMAEYTREVDELLLNVANNTEGTIAAYIRYNPEIAEPTAGVFWSRKNLEDSFYRTKLTDISQYDPSDVEHVGWYYIPIANGKATWMQPYLNENIDVYMISYVIPLYKGGQLVGIVGMDIDFNAVAEKIKAINVYESGYAFLTDDKGNIMYHDTLKAGTSMQQEGETLIPVAEELKKESSGSELFEYEWGGVNKKMAFRSLSNGMRLIITAPSSEIDAEKNQLVKQIFVATGVIAAFFIAITVVLTHRIIRPLKELNVAAQKAAEGDLTVSFTCNTKDEVGTLAASFRQMEKHLQKYINYINGLAYRDSLTGVRNKTAYQDTVRQIDTLIGLGQARFAVVVMDINGLKAVNDSCGHDAGDILIISVSSLIVGVFRNSIVYRIGGDEFVVILENEDYENRRGLMESFEEAVRKEQQSISGESCGISAAGGIAVYTAGTDRTFADVFKRADTAMYENKAEMKAGKKRV